MRLAKVAKIAAAMASAGFLSLLAACGNGLEGAAQSTGPTVTIGVSTDLPYLSLQEGDKYSGFDIDVAKYVAQKLGYSYKQIIWKQVPPGQSASDLNSGVVGMVIGGYSITAKAKEDVDFAGPYLVQKQKLLVSDRNKSITSLQDLSGKSVCVQEGSAAESVIKSALGPDVAVHTLPSTPQCVTELFDGTVQAVSAGGVLLSALNKFKGGGYLKVVGNGFATEYMGIAVKKNSPGLVYQINQDIKLMITSGTWKRDLEATVGQTGYKITPYNAPDAISAQDSQETISEGTVKND
ncbi:MAG: transporter substrate-binding domain-containing protein [Aeriscardovia sp.]|nr:transporter substrate-binding domain-containing protein [Aeriscardovia sp.]